MVWRGAKCGGGGDLSTYRQPSPAQGVSRSVITHDPAHRAIGRLGGLPFAPARSSAGAGRGTSPTKLASLSFLEGESRSS